MQHSVVSSCLQLQAFPFTLSWCIQSNIMFLSYLGCSWKSKQSFRQKKKRKTFLQMMSLLSLLSQHLFLLFFVVKEKSPKNSFDLLPVRGQQCSNLITFNPKFGWCELNPVPDSAAQAFSRLKLSPANSATAQGQQHHHTSKDHCRLLWQAHKTETL